MRSVSQLPTDESSVVVIRVWIRTDPWVYYLSNPWRLSCGKITKRVCYKCGSSEHEGTRAVMPYVQSQPVPPDGNVSLLCQGSPDTFPTIAPPPSLRIVGDKPERFSVSMKTVRNERVITCSLLPTTQNCQHEMSRINRYSRLENVGRQVFAGAEC